MSKRFFTSDFHLNSTLINKYASRPIPEALESSVFLCKNANEKCSKSDILIHVGDFCLTSKDSHGEETDVPLDYPPEYWLDNLKPNVLLLSGNHDDGHSLETAGKCLLLDLNQNFRNVTVGHYPSDQQGYQGNYGDQRHLQIHLCGHVHNAWLLKYDHKHNVLNVNVGVDVWNYCPVSDVQLTELLEFILKYKFYRIQSEWLKDHPKDRMFGHNCKESFQWKRSHLEEFRKRVESELEAGRAKRKAERYAKKGLTPEECQRRKEEAMRKKGLL